MKRFLCGARMGLLITLFAVAPGQAADFFVSPAGSTQPPFASWGTAATNIQDAIDAASAGDTVWVTNGVYAAGGKVIAGDLTNRVALDQSLLVQSVNGPEVTIIQGSWDAAPGPTGVRCAWLTNGATLSGFSLQGGVTRSLTSPGNTQELGGGVFCSSATSTVTNCVIAYNLGGYSGGGGYQGTYVNCTFANNSAIAALPTPTDGGAGGGVAYGTLLNCLLTGNSAVNAGGAAYFCHLKNCALVGNWARVNGGAAYSGSLVNCTVSGNSVGAAGVGGQGGAIASATLTNCVVVGNVALSLSLASNYAGSGFTYSCALPLPPGKGNIGADPQLLADGIHLSPTSPCRGAGTNTVVSGIDIDGQAWANPPSMGCDEWQPAPSLIGQAAIHLGAYPLTLNVSIPAAAGQDPFGYSWMKDGAFLTDGLHYSGTQTTSLLVNGIGLADAGTYQLVVTNASGVATSTVIPVVIHCVDASNAAPAAPYNDWSTAATNIQDAIGAAAAGDLVLVTNGFYANGGRAMTGDLTNRVAVDRPLTVTSLNGAATTTVQGAWDPATTNGPLAVRCAWLMAGGSLQGFTLQGGATRTNSNVTGMALNGGGVWAASTNAWLADCVIATNAAYLLGGGAYSGSFVRCSLLGNAANRAGGGCEASLLQQCMVVGNHSQSFAGGADQSILVNCLLRGNSAVQSGGGAFNGTLINCTVTGNSSGSQGGGVVSSPFCNLTNSIIFGNTAPFPSVANWFGPVSSAFCCSTPPLPGIGNGNISVDPQLLDGIHIAATSPCRGAGNSAYTIGGDIDGEPWANPPSMGCDEVWETNIIGPLSVSLTSQYPSATATGSLLLSGQVTGRASRVAWDYGDGSSLTNASYLSVTHVWTNAGMYTVAFTAFNADNPAGVSTNLVLQVLPLAAPSIALGAYDGTNFGLSFTGQFGVSYVVEETSDLTPPSTWQAVATRLGSGALIQVTDTRATNATGFYRVRTQ